MLTSQRKTDPKNEKISIEDDKEASEAEIFSFSAPLFIIL